MSKVLLIASGVFGGVALERAFYGSSPWLGLAIASGCLAFAGGCLEEFMRHRKGGGLGAPDKPAV